MIFFKSSKSHWLVNDSVSKKFIWCLLGIVIDRSMTLFVSSKIVIDRSMTFPKSHHMYLFQDTVIDRSMTLSREACIQSKKFRSKFSKKCHWPVNDIFLMDIVSLAYGQMSLTSVNDKKTYGHCHWPRSMTLKSVIDHGQWHFSVSLTVSILYGVRFDPWESMRRLDDGEVVLARIDMDPVLIKVTR